MKNEIYCKKTLKIWNFDWIVFEKYKKYYISGAKSDKNGKSYCISYINDFYSENFAWLNSDMFEEHFSDNNRFIRKEKLKKILVFGDEMDFVTKRMKKEE